MFGARIIIQLMCLFELCPIILSDTYMHSNDIRCLKTPAGTQATYDDCMSYEKKCFPFTHNGCVPRSANWFYTEKMCNDICGHYINEANKSNTENVTESGPLPENVTERGPLPENISEKGNTTTNQKVFFGSSNNGNDRPCSELPAFGSCEIMYTYRRGECKEFIFSAGNCGKNMNLFSRIEECESSCGNMTKACEQMPFKEGMKCSKANSTSAMRGLGPVPRFSYNGGTCTPFWYYGCGGTQNNFVSLLECEKICSNGENTQPRSTTRSPSWIMPTLKTDYDDTKVDPGAEGLENSIF
ncbi:unnamed protein product [Lepeophtheirus salmonis]|uniref:(salmon louse) hypothetical protein n=1 Tax=Lepeophtheirus salmonis TaxID=72036 RepID=A0A7R8D6K0_LEPSM|nr:unnamed protein product [Lepeophtheirus salmonis]CAF3045843.1 unnamed protein product [Lepeophtheirus salmonis]